MTPGKHAWARLSCALLIFCTAAAGAQDAREWLARMNRAVEEVNYEGTFVHVYGNKSETMNIVHRNHHGQISERLRSRDGAGREIIREEDVVRVILPEQRMVLIEPRRDASELVSALPSYCAELEPHYEFTLGAGTRVANRPVHVLAITPSDEYRYGYALYLDRETAMPLKSLLLNEHGEVIEQIVFTQIQISDFIPASALHPEIDTEGFQFLRAEPQADDGDAVVEVSPSWRASMLPPGFRLSAATQSAIAGSDYPVSHLVYSDCLATVSVFIEDPNTNADMGEGFSSVGPMNAYSRKLNGRSATVIGEVPPQVVRSIALSLSPE